MTLPGPIPTGLWLSVAIGTALLAGLAYVIKMRRRRFEVPFSPLWQRVVQQNDPNALWKRLRRVLSLLLVLAILGAILFAALDPTLGGANREARSMVILVDASASMQTMDGNAAGTQSRIQAAKNRAAQLVDAMSGGDVALVMKADAQATPVTRFTTDHALLAKSIQGIVASDTPGDLRRALSAAADALRDRPNPLIVLISDGAFPESQLGNVDWGNGGPAARQNLATIDLSRHKQTGHSQGSAQRGGTTGSIDVRYVPIGRSDDNVGIVAFNVRRYIANKAAYEVFIEIRNFGKRQEQRQLTLYNGQSAVDSRQLDLAPGERVRQLYDKIPGGEDNQLRAQLRPATGSSAADAFPLDDTAYALLPARKKQNVLMVTADNLFLEGALLVYDNVDPLKVTPAEYDAAPGIAEGMDVVIFDDVTPEVVPPPPTSLIYFHPTGPHSPIAVRPRAATNPHITEIDEGHPVMRWVTLADVYMDRSEVFIPNATNGESPLAFSVTDPIIAAKRDGHRKIVAFGFSLPASGRTSGTDLPMRVAFPMLLVNALDWFAGDEADLLTTYPTGQRHRVALDGAVDAIEAEIRGPDGPASMVARSPVLDGLATFFGTRVGYYDLFARGPSGNTVAHVRLAANLASARESDIAPSVELTLGGKKLSPPDPFAINHSQKLWIYLLLFAVGLLTIEWITYHRRITV